MLGSNIKHKHLFDIRKCTVASVIRSVEGLRFSAATEAKGWWTLLWKAVEAPGIKGKGIATGQPFVSEAE